MAFIKAKFLNVVLINIKGEKYQKMKYLISEMCKEVASDILCEQKTHRSNIIWEYDEI